MKDLKFWLIGLLSFFALQAQAANWVYVGTDTEGGMWSVDTSSFRQASNRPDDVWFWVTQTNKKTNKKLQTGTTKTQYHVSCRTKTIAALDVVQYSAQGNVINSYPSRGDYDFNMTSIVPETMGDTIATYACTQAGKTQ